MTKKKTSCGRFRGEMARIKIKVASGGPLNAAPFKTTEPNGLGRNRVGICHQDRNDYPRQSDEISIYEEGRVYKRGSLQKVVQIVRNKEKCSQKD